MERTQLTFFSYIVCVSLFIPRLNSTKSKLQFLVPVHSSVTKEPQKVEFTTGLRNTTTRSDTSGLSDEYALFLDPL